jgi:predicted metal-dependent phosphotriesterase family hydrolase
VDRPEDPNQTTDTFDYGLAPGETFEPADFGEIDRSQPHIMTVLGPVEPGALGVTNPLAAFATGLDDPLLLLNEIEEAGYAGINALLNIAPIRSAGEAERAHWLAGRSDLHLMMTAAPRPDGNDAVSLLLDEIERGIDGSGILPAAIVTPVDVSPLRVARQASDATGLPLIITVDEADEGTSLLHALEGEGIDPTRVTMAADTSLDLARQILRFGASLIIPLERGEVANEQARMIARLVEEGFGEQLLPGFNPRDGVDALSYAEGSRWSWLIEQFPLQLLNAGLDALTVRTLMIENPNRMLTIELPGAPGSPQEAS